MKEVMSRIQLALVFMSGWLRYSLAEIVKVAQVFASKSGSNIDEQVAQIFIDIHSLLAFELVAVHPMYRNITIQQ